MSENKMVRLANRWKPTEFINIETGKLTTGLIAPGWLSAQWEVEPVAGTPYFRFKNVWKPDQYIHIENAIPAAGSIAPGWLSAQWEFEEIPGTVYSRIRNRWNLIRYAHIQFGPIDVGHAEPGWLSAQWLLEKVEGSSIVRLRNRWQTDQCIHIQNGSLSSGHVEPGWLSAHWSVEKISGTPYVRFQNVWKPDEYFHIQNGQAESGPIQPGWLSAQWLLEPVSDTDFVYLRNRWEIERYLHIEGGALDAGMIQPGWLSAQWLKVEAFKVAVFNPSIDAFQFRNTFDLTHQEAAQSLDIMPGVILDLVKLNCINEVKDALNEIKVEIPVPLVENPTVYLTDVISVDSLINRIASYVLEKLAGLVDELREPLVSGGGFCGGMAFGGYDFYRQGWPVSHFGSITPPTGELHDYLFQRQLNSLELNGATFVEWWTKVYILPKISPVASAALAAAVGSLAGPVGAAFGALIGGKEDFLDLGGPKSVFRPTKDQWSQIKGKLDVEVAWPIGMIFSNKSNLFDQHQVLAIGYTDHDGTATLEVWDNKDGNQSQTLILDFRGNQLEVSGSNVTPDNRCITGIFLEEYIPRQPPSTLGPP